MEVKGQKTYLTRQKYVPVKFDYLIYQIYIYKY